MAFTINHSPGRIVHINNEEYLYFGGTSYLGLHQNPDFTAKLLSNIRLYGSTHGSSRLSNLRLDIYEKAEDHLANWAGSAKSLTVSSGFLAGQLLSSYFDTEQFRTFYAPNTHAALHRSHSDPYIDMDSLGSDLKQHLNGNSRQTPVLFIDSVYLDGTGYPDFAPLKELPLQEVILVADDSHGLGILGDAGGGSYRALMNLRPKELLVCASLGKALAVQGGVIFGSERYISGLWETPFFAGASPAPPAHLATLVEADPLYKKSRRLLFTNIKRLEELWINRQGFNSVSKYPVIAFNYPQLTVLLHSEKILVTDFTYPGSKAAAAPGRIVLSAHHLKSDIERLANILNAFTRFTIAD